MKLYEHETFLLEAEASESTKTECLGPPYEEDLASFFEHAAAAMHCVGPDGTILRANRAQLEMLGYAREEYVGHPIAEFHADQSAIADILQRLTRGETLHDYEARLRCKDGSVKHVLIDSNVLWKDDRFIHARCFTRDITARKHAEQALQESAQRLAAEVQALENVHELIARLSSSAGLDGALEEVLQASLTISGTAMGLLQLWNPQVRALEIVAHRGLGQHFLDSFCTVRGEATTARSMAMNTGAPVVIEDTERDPFFEPYRAVAASAGFRAVHSTPLRGSGGEVLGVISLYFPVPHRPSQRKQRIVDLYAHHAANLIERIRAEEAKAKLAAIVESSADAIVSKDLDGVITSWNAGAEKLFGYTAEEAIGRSITMLIPADRVDEEPSILERIRRGERVEHYETIRRRKDGTLLNISLTVSPVVDRRGKVVGASKIARDITNRKQAEAEREELLAIARRARAEAESASRAKDDFLSVLSHELRTPLASVLGWVRVLKTGVTGERAATAMNAIERSGLAQAKLIEDLLDVSRIASGQMRLDLRLVDLPAVIRAALDTVRPTAEAKGVRIDVHVAAEAGPVAGDNDRLQQVVWNLLSNAVKFTPAGGSIRLDLERRESDVRLVVRDTGCGIAPEFVPFVFERFRQAGIGESRRSGGLGLGLAIVRHLVELHGGTVAVVSEGDGKGAEFTVTLPLVPFSVELDGDARPAARLLDGVLALIVEDDRDAADALDTLLEAHGARVVAARTVEEARSFLGESRPDVLLCDIRLPDGNGYELLREIHRTKHGRHLPAIAITGYESEDARIILAAGYQMRLSKPVNPDLLVAAVFRLTANVADAPRAPLPATERRAPDSDR